MFKFMLSVVLLIAASAAQAKDKEKAPIITSKKLDPASFVVYQEELRNEMKPGGRFQYVSEVERERVNACLDKMVSLLEGHSSVAELSEDEKVELLNAQEKANAILTERDRDRLICERTKLVGSHFVQTVCQTYGELEERKNRNKRDAKKLERQGQTQMIKG